MSRYITAVPLPSFGDFFHLSSLRCETLGAPWKVGRDNHTMFFPRGSRAFVEIARGVAETLEKAICFFPAYFCESSIAPLRSSGARIVFYRVTPELEPDWEDVRRRAKALRPALFVLVHTFGLVQNRSEALVFAKETGCVILEDAAHVLVPENSIGEGETVVLFSPHKLLALPPIAVLSVPDSLVNRIRNPYRVAWRKHDWVWLTKRMVQKGIVAFGRLGIKAKPKSGEFESENNGASQNMYHPNEISQLGLHLLLAEQQHLSNIARNRRENFSFLACVMAEIPGIEIPKPFIKWPQETAPYTFPFFTDADRMPLIYATLWRLGIPAQRWPDLPPEVASRPEEYPQACYWRKNLLLLPVHQSLSLSQTEAMGAALKKVLRREG